MEGKGTTLRVTALGRKRVGAPGSPWSMRLEGWHRWRFKKLQSVCNLYRKPGI
jgi:hypothetical protein